MTYNCSIKHCGHQRLWLSQFSISSFLGRATSTLGDVAEERFTCSPDENEA